MDVPVNAGCKWKPIGKWGRWGIAAARGRRGSQLNIAAEAATIGLATGDGPAVAATESKELNLFLQSLWNDILKK